MAQSTARTAGSIAPASRAVVVEPPPDPQVPGGAEKFFNDFIAAMHDYPEQFVTLEIVDVEIPGEFLNVTDTGKFLVRLTNNGSLDMTDVTLKVIGLAGALVKTGGAADFEFRPSLTIAMDSDTIRGGGGVSLTKGSKLQFQAPTGTRPEGTTLFKATIETWNGSLSRILNVHSHDEPDGPAGTYQNEVVGT